MIIKTYIANTNISINVVLPSKKNFHITFTPLSMVVVYLPQIMKSYKGQ